MPGEVTRKDLQALQTSVNKQFKGIETSVGKCEAEISVVKDIQTAFERAMSKQLTELSESFQKQLGALQTTLQDEISEVCADISNKFQQQVQALREEMTTRQAAQDVAMSRIQTDISSSFEKQVQALRAEVAALKRG